MPTSRRARHLCWQTLLLLLAACSNGRGSLEEQQPPTSGAEEGFSIGGTVTGLIGSGLVLQNNGDGDLAVTADGPFTFNRRLGGGTSYNVTVLSQPVAPSQTCTVANGSGSVVAAPVTSIVITCANAQYSVGGTVSELAGAGLVLQNNGRDDLPVSANGPFMFGERLASGASYNVTVRSHPAGQNCVIRNASGIIDAASIGNVDVACASDRYAVGGTISGLAGAGLVLQLNGGNDLRIVSPGAFAFGQALASGTAYAISVKAQPANPAQVCTVTNGSGVISGSNVTDVAVRCVSSTFSVGGTVSGLSGSGLALQLNDGNPLVITSNGSFTFGARLSSGAQYRVVVATQPADPVQICTVSGGSGTVGSADITSISVTCAAETFAIGGTVNGLLGSGLVLQNNGSDAIAISSNGSFRFPTRLASGAAYRISVRAQPSSPQQACTVTNGRGVVGTADIGNVVVSCNTSDFTIGGTVQGLAGSGLVLLNNGADELPIDSDGSFTFDTALPAGARYEVIIAKQPTNPGQTCVVENGSGIVLLGNVTNVTVRCASSGFRVGGEVSMLRGSGLVLENNGADDLAIASSGRFTFSTPLPRGAPYNVTVATQPSNPTQTCTVRHGSGTIDAADVDDIEIRCRDDDDDDDD